MAQFMDVMKILKRICEYDSDSPNGSCTTCPLFALKIDCSTFTESIDTLSQVEDLVVLWAEKHPYDKRYPTIRELIDGKYDLDMPIPEDLANKLGVKRVEDKKQ